MRLARFVDMAHPAAMNAISWTAVITLSTSDRAVAPCPIKISETAQPQFSMSALGLRTSGEWFGLEEC